MVKPGFSESMSVGRTGAELRRAGDVVGQVRAGEQVAPDAVAHAGEALVDALWGGEASQLALAQDGLPVLIGATREADAQGQLLGDVVAAGARGGPVLDRLTAPDAGAASVAGMSPEELRTLRSSLGRSTRERLEVVADMLRAEMPPGQEVPGRSSPPGNEGPGQWALTQRQTSIESVETAGPGDESPSISGPDGEDLAPHADQPGQPAYEDAEAALTDPSLDPSQRVGAAMLIGSGAIPLLGTMLGRSRDEREVAAVALMRLGAQPETARQVHDRMKLLEGEPAVRPTAEYIRRGIESGGGTWSANQRHLADQADMGEGWLGRAIASCDRPGILTAAAGREIRAIPLALRQLASMRSRRHADGG